MSEDNYNKDDKGYSFIQEQINPKRKGKRRRMMYSIVWTIILACIFGVVAGVVFCITEPTIYKFLGKSQDKKTVEFPTLAPEEGDGKQPEVSVTPTPTSTVNTPDEVVSKGDQENSQPTKEEETGSNTLVIENYIQADIQDLNSMYSDIRDIANDVNDSIVEIISSSSSVDVFNSEYDVVKSTTGLVLANNNADILILVSYDTIKDAKDLFVKINDSLQIKARIQDYDTDLNLAVVALSLSDLPDSVVNTMKPAVLGESYSLVIGTPIIALGSPNGYVNSMELGIISSKGSSVSITDNKIDLFNTDINFNENSNGVIVNLKGEVIGVITNKLKDEQNEDVSTVIGISKIKKIIESMVNQTDRCYFGIKGMDMTDAALLDWGLENGICVTEVEADSPALKGGLQSGDMITAINDVSVLNMNNFNSLISSYEPKTTVKVTIRRKVKGEAKDKELSVILDKINE